MKPITFFSLFLISTLTILFNDGNLFSHELVPIEDDIMNTEYSIGDKWTYETVYYLSEDFQEINFETIEIVDTASVAGKESYRLSNTDVFYVEDDKMYFWDEGLGTFEMYYDFSSDLDYTIKYFNQFTGDTLFADIIIDSVYDIAINDTVIGARDIKVFGSDSHPDGWVGTVYDNIGIGWDGPKIDLDCGLCDPTVFIHGLRCFENESQLLNFKEYECDSIFSIDSSPPIYDLLPIVSSDQTWIEQTTDFGPSESFQYFYSEDSILLDNAYYFERIQSNNQDGSEPYVEGYYREYNNRLYKKDGDSERMIVNMNLILGDVIFIDQGYETAQLEVIAVDTIMYNDNILRKRIELNCYFNSDDYGSIFWVEGIGELSSGIYCVLDGGQSFVRCVLDENNERIYSIIGENESCWITTSTIEIPTNQLSVYPNPAKKLITISGLENKLDYGYIFNIDGDLSLNISNDIIDISGLVNGLYLIKAIDVKGNIYTAKIVKSND